MIKDLVKITDIRQSIKDKILICVNQKNRRRKNEKEIFILGLILVVFSFLYSTCLIWEVFENLRAVIYHVEYDNYSYYYNMDYKILLAKITATSMLLSISLAQASLLLLISNTKKFVNIIVKLTIFIIFVVIMLILYLVWGEVDLDNYIYRMLGVACILDVLGTIVSPILNKVYKKEMVKETKTEIKDEKIEVIEE